MFDALDRSIPFPFVFRLAFMFMIRCVIICTSSQGQAIVRYTSPVNIKFLFGGYGRLVYAEAGDAVAESLVGRLTSCKRVAVRTISGE